MSPRRLKEGMPGAGFLRARPEACTTNGVCVCSLSSFLPPSFSSLQAPSLAVAMGDTVVEPAPLKPPSEPAPGPPGNTGGSLLACHHGGVLGALGD